MSLTTDRSHPDLPRGVDDKPVDQAKVYCVLDEKEIAKGFIRPFRKTYWHLTCKLPTTMADAIAATYASDPYFYGGAYCANCHMHRDHSEFVWRDPTRVLYESEAADVAWKEENSLDPLLWPDALVKEVSEAKKRRAAAREAAGKPANQPEQYWKTAPVTPQATQAPRPTHARLVTAGNTVLVSWSDGEMTEVRIPPRPIK